MIKPFFKRKYQPTQIGEDNSWLLWRWFDITSDTGLGSAAGKVYLRRLYLFRCPWFSMIVNNIKRPDPDRDLHDHPWNFLSFIFSGYYQEELAGGSIKTRRWFNRCRAADAHRIAYVSRRCITLVLCGPKQRSWGFHTKEGWTDWRTYLDR